LIVRDGGSASQFIDREERLPESSDLCGGRRRKREEASEGAEYKSTFKNHEVAVAAHTGTAGNRELLTLGKPSEPENGQLRGDTRVSPREGAL
jgi:hypothetical protein